MNGTRYEPVEFIDVTTRPDGQGGRVADTVHVYHTLAKPVVTKEKRNWVTSQVILPAGLQLTLWARQAYEPGADTRVKFRGREYTIQSKAYADQATRREWVLTLQSNGHNGTDTGPQQPPAVAD